MIRPAAPEDVPAILALIRELADYERLQDEVEASAESLREHLFGDRPWCSALVASPEGQVVGYALFYPCYSSFKAQPALFLEDLYVTPAARGRGHGKALLRGVAAAARERGAARMDWNVLDWNQPAIDFYHSLGAKLLGDWRLCRIQGEALERLAAVR
jgi:ribosomal protein S18 acetylase RimI-like enzyme